MWGIFFSSFLNVGCVLIEILFHSQLLIWDDKSRGLASSWLSIISYPMYANWHNFDLTGYSTYIIIQQNQNVLFWTALTLTIKINTISNWLQFALKRLYMCIETTSVCVETTCIKTTLYRNDHRKPLIKIVLKLLNDDFVISFLHRVLLKKFRVPKENQSMLIFFFICRHFWYLIH